MFDDSISLNPNKKLVQGPLESQLPPLNVPPQHKGMIDSITSLFGNTAGSAWLSMNQSKTPGGDLLAAMGVPEDADQAMQMATKARMDAQSQSQSQGKGGNGESMGNSVGDLVKFIGQLFAG
jgi:hypothetical protein